MAAAAASFFAPSGCMIHVGRDQYKMLDTLVLIQDVTGTNLGRDRYREGAMAAAAASYLAPDEQLPHA